MKVLGVFLKILGVLVMLAGTAVCTAVSMEAAVTEAYIAMGAAWVCAIILGFVIFGLGSVATRVSRLEKRVAALESAPRVAVPEGSAAPAGEGYTAPVTPTPKKKKSKGWIIVLIVVGVLVILAVAAVILIRSTVVQPEAQLQSSVVTEEVSFVSGDEESPAPAAEAVELAMGELLATDFVEITFEDMIIDYDVKHSVTIDNVTRITGPDPLDGQQYICLTGTIRNLATEPLPVYDFFIGNLCIDGYNYSATANDIDVLNSDGSTESTIAPLVDYDFRLYIAIPDSLAEIHSSCTFTFGFFDSFENQELSYIRAWEDNPVSLCPYQYNLIVK